MGLRTARTPSSQEGVTVVPTKCYVCSRLRTYKWQVVFLACYITISQDVSTGLALHLHFSTCNRQEPGRWIEEWGHPDGICVSSSLLQTWSMLGGFWSQARTWGTIRSPMAALFISSGRNPRKVIACSEWEQVFGDIPLSIFQRSIVASSLWQRINIMASFTLASIFILAWNWPSVICQSCLMSCQAYIG